MTKPWRFPLDPDWLGQIIPVAPHPGGFGVIRKHHIHEGVDLYAYEGAQVHAVESGTVVAVLPFTGQSVGSPWWHDTMCVMVEGDSGVVNYGEVVTAHDIVPGHLLFAGAVIGWVKQVLKKDKGRPMSMLHLELYSTGTIEPVEWKVGETQPQNLQDPTQHLLRANLVGVEGPHGTGSCRHLSALVPHQSGPCYLVGQKEGGRVSSGHEGG